MINLPCNATSMSQVTPCQNVPVQTSQYNFPTCQQRQTSTQQMQTATCGPCPGTSQGPFVYQSDAYVVTHQCAPPSVSPTMTTNPCRTVFQGPCNPTSPAHTSCGQQLPPNILEQIRTCIAGTPSIFILPGSCQQSPTPQQPQQPQQPVTTMPQAMPSSSPAYPSSGLTYPAAYYPPPPPPPPPPPSSPSFYPYPIPMPFCDSFARVRDVARNCGCCRKRDVDPLEIGRFGSCLYDEQDEHHRCVPTVDDTVCTRRNCPASLHLQALASQFLSMQGVIPCAATRLLLRKVPGSNVTTSMEDTMAKAQRAISVLTKDQLLSESRNAQQVNALINLHMTSNAPPNVIPILTLVQLKVNLLKAQVEGRVNQKVMESQGIGIEVETALIDPTILALKSDAELRDFLTLLRQKECDERMNVNFAPYRSQRAIAESRLCNIQNKIRQVEAEFDRRRCAVLPSPTLTSRIVQQFSGSCFPARFVDHGRLYGSLPIDVPRSPDPFVPTKPSPRRLLLRPCTTGKQKTAGVDAASSTVATADPPKTTNVDRAKEPSASVDRRRSSTECCNCRDRTTSEESVDEAKKKLCPRIIEIDAPSTVSNVVGSDQSAPSSAKLTLNNVYVRIIEERYETSSQKYDERDVTSDECIPKCGAKCWMTTAYINVVDESIRNPMESHSDAIISNGKIDAVDEARGAIEISRLGRITDRRDFGSSTNLRQFEEQAAGTEMVSRRDETIEEYEPKSTRDVSPPKAERDDETKATIIAEANDSISNVRKTEQKSSDGVHISSLKTTFELKRGERENEEKGKSDEIAPLSVDETAERSANRVPVGKSKKRTTFHIISFMNNIVYDKNYECQKKRKSDKRITITSKRGMNLIINPNIEELDKYGLMEDILENTIVHDIKRKDHSENIIPKKLNFSKFYIDRQCQTTFEEDKRPPAALRRTNIFPPFKNLHKYMADNEKNEENERTYSSPITDEGITTTKRLFHRNDIAENILEIFYKNNAPYRFNVRCEDGFISKLFAVIGDRVTRFINKILALNRSLLNSSPIALLCRNSNTDVTSKNVPTRDIIRDRS